jgi:hypothetical protein
MNKNKLHRSLGYSEVKQTCFDSNTLKPIGAKKRITRME